MHNLNSELRFPKPPFRIDPSPVDLLPQAVSSYLDQVRSWRQAVVEFIGGSSGKPAPETDGLTERAQKALATFLADRWTEGMTDYVSQSPYNISPFPASALEGASNPPMESVFEILQWRAAVVDYLSDVWDVIGDPFLDIDECGAIDKFLRPVSKVRLCSFCLTEFASGQLDSGHDCMLTSHVRAKWPPMPPAFARWAKHAGDLPATTSTDLPPKTSRDVQVKMPTWRQWREKWSQFWK